MLQKYGTASSPSRPELRANETVGRFSNLAIVDYGVGPDFSTLGRMLPDRERSGRDRL